MKREELTRKTYSIPQAAVILGIGSSRAYELARSGELPGVRNLGGKFLVSRKELDAFLDGEPASGS
ncbi:helix-turn-helix domain-containing protein [Glutamicibacter protophormiae]|uniref:helix-turn-helix domain-containing protein n=1 Tax=Glutamicibacter protophormiae TaxID=37930 RepID=UPI002A7F61E7|nr:helix-turn-helix domain-containing protein [Glutamicibacter protophormiae]WPR66436.1 helix-turn-helix domain-containing protein [Glutamicibacter protophormiae]WPR69931.1 helix-turn-helix domain-containing protein [Glutamicibacter protophormiae]